MATSPARLAAVIRAMLHYSFKDIGYAYALLTPEEKRLCTAEEFADVMTWLALSDAVLP